MEIRSPITRAANVRELYQINVSELASRWLNAMEIDISGEVGEAEIITCFECEDTRLRFFKPDAVAGSGDFYGALQQFDWYYMPHKWEHEAALEDISPGDKVLEVGCGKGDFVHRLNAIHGADAVGIELNAAAVCQAQADQKNVRLMDLSDVAQQEQGTYDVVCHFQVLEHVVNPMHFLRLCLQSLRRGGKLLLAVPNMGEFVGKAKGSLLNQPPHHMSQWFPETLEALPRYLPVSLRKLKFEPLAPYHQNWYVNVQLGRLPTVHDNNQRGFCYG